MIKIKYIFFLLIPVFFSLGSCAAEQRKPDDFMSFSDNIPLAENDHVSQASKIEKKPLPVKTAIAGKASIPEMKVKAESPPSPQYAAESKTVPAAQPADTPLRQPRKVAGSADKRNPNELNTTKRFNIGYINFNVADFYAEITPVKENTEFTEYKFRFYSKTNAFVDYLFGWMCYSVSYFRIYDDRVIPERFQTKGTLKKKTREIFLTYDENGKLLSEKVTPPDNRGKRPAVPDDKKRSSYDPLSLIVEARKLIITAFKANNFNSRNKYNFTLPLYDGRKRSDVYFELDRKKVNDLYHLKIIQKAVAGYTNNELEEAKKGERSIDIFIDPSNFWPVSATGMSPVGNAHARYLETCRGNLDDCVKIRR